MLTTSRPLTVPPCTNSTQRSMFSLAPDGVRLGFLRGQPDLVGAGRQRLAVGRHCLRQVHRAERQIAGRGRGRRRGRRLLVRRLVLRECRGRHQRTRQNSHQNPLISHNDILLTASNLDVRPSVARTRRSSLQSRQLSVQQARLSEAECNRHATVCGQAAIRSQRVDASAHVRRHEIPAGGPFAATST